MKIKEAYMAGPGPENGREAVLLAAKGFCMGSADIIPGVSGGTIAFITGIYWQLIAAIKSVNGRFIKNFLTLNWTEAFSEVHLKFLLPLLLGIGIAVVSMARVMHYLLNNHPVEIWSLFFGLILASIFVVGRSIGRFSVSVFIAGILGVAAGYLIVGLIPVTTPETLPFIFLCGALAICAMILPGISGSFILLILGKYIYVTGALKNPFDGGNLVLLGVFALGCLAGLAVFSRVLHFFMTRWQSLAMALLTGFMVGSMRKIWPWKEILETVTVRGKVHVLREKNILPPDYGSEFVLAVGLMLVGLVAVFALDWISRRKTCSDVAESV